MLFFTTVVLISSELQFTVTKQTQFKFILVQEHVSSVG